MAVMCSESCWPRDGLCHPTYLTPGAGMFRAVASVPVNRVWGETLSQEMLV